MGFKVQLNTVAWVEGNIINAVDPSGKYWWIESNVSSFMKPDESFGNFQRRDLINKIIQSQAINNSNVHAEYPVTYTYEGRIWAPHIDLMMVNDANTQIRYWEIKPNNSNQINRAKRALRNLAATGIPQNKLAGHFSQQSCLSRQHSCQHPRGDNYDWNNYTWIRGTDYPRKQLVLQTTDGEAWYAGQKFDNGNPVPGLIVYWSEDERS